MLATITTALALTICPNLLPDAVNGGPVTIDPAPYAAIAPGAVFVIGTPPNGYAPAGVVYGPARCS